MNECDFGESQLFYKLFISGIYPSDHLSISFKSELLLSHSDVDFLELVKSCQNTSTSNATQDVCTSSLHHRHESLVLQDLHGAIDGTFVLDSLSGCHHHSSSDCIHWI